MMAHQVKDVHEWNEKAKGNSLYCFDLFGLYPSWLQLMESSEVSNKLLLLIKCLIMIVVETEDGTLVDLLSCFFLFKVRTVGDCLKQVLLVVIVLKSCWGIFLSIIDTGDLNVHKTDLTIQV